MSGALPRSIADIESFMAKASKEVKISQHRNEFLDAGRRGQQSLLAALVRRNAMLSY
jgi:hypothetical protein